MIIAEIAQAHDGSLGIAHSYIDALADTGIDAIKFQMHIADAESSEYEPFRKKFSYADATRFDYWKRIEFSFEQWQGLKQHCDEKNLLFICSPFSNEAVEQLENLHAKIYKIGSGEITNHLMLEKIAGTKKPVILSSGMSNWEELDEAVNIFLQKNIDCTVMQCTSAYPTLPEQWGLNVIEEIKERYKTKVGFSDHSGNMYALLAAAALGADVFEFHAVFDKRMFGPDSAASLEISTIKKLTDGIKQIKTALQHNIQKDNIVNNEMKYIFEKSLAVNQSLKKGTIITTAMLEAKKPKGFGIAAEKYKSIIGKMLVNNKVKGDFLKDEDVE